MAEYKWPVTSGGGGGTGDVVGPVSATDNALVRFDGTTGELIQNSNATLSDLGVMSTTEIGSSVFGSLAAANPATTGLFRLAKTDQVVWRNNANSANLTLGISAANRLQFAIDDVPTVSSSDTFTNKTIVVANNTITTAASGNLAATNLNAALAELQSDIDTRATIASPTFTGTVTTPTIALGAGLVGTPAYTFTGDLNTGMWSSAADTLDFSTAGASALQITPTQSLFVPAAGGSAFTTSATQRYMGNDRVHFVWGTGTSNNVSMQIRANTYNNGTNNVITTTGAATARLIIAGNTSVSGNALNFTTDSTLGSAGATLTETSKFTVTSEGTVNLGPTSGDGLFTNVNRLFRLVKTTTNINVAANATINTTQMASTAINSSYVRLVTASGAFNLDGIVALTEGTILYVENQSGQTMTVRHNGAGEGTAANQIFTATAGSFTFVDGTVAQFMYSGGKAKWLLTNRF